MKRGVLRFVLPAAVFLIIFIVPGTDSSYAPARRGVLDLSAVSHQIVPLSGEWELLRSSAPAADEGPVWKRLPCTWEEPFGYASYRLLVRGLDPGRAYALRVPYMSTGFRLLIDGTEVFRNGSPGVTKESSVPGYLPGLVSLPAETSSFELSLEVSNFHHRRGGPFQTILLGERAPLERYEFWCVFTDAMVTAVFLLLGSMYLMNAFLRRYTPALYLALFFICIGVSGFVCTPEVLIFRLVPGFDWNLYQKIGYLATYGIPLFMLFATRSLFGGLHTRAFLFLAAPFASVYLIVLSTSPVFFTRLNIVFQLVSFIGYAAAFALCVLGVERGRPFARTLTAGFLIFIGTALSSTLFANNKILQGQYLPLSFLSALFDLSPLSRRILDVFSYACVLVLINVFSVIFFLKSPAGPEIESGPGDRVPHDRADGETVREKALAAGLSSREAEVVVLMLRGRRNLEICDELCISLSTVKTHVSRIFRKLGVTSRSGLFRYFAR
jgi:DNA-binding CsgD family transcriptional regulator